MSQPSFCQGGHSKCRSHEPSDSWTSDSDSTDSLFTSSDLNRLRQPQSLHPGYIPAGGNRDGHPFSPYREGGSRLYGLGDTDMSRLSQISPTGQAEFPEISCHVATDKYTKAKVVLGKPPIPVKSSPKVRLPLLSTRAARDKPQGFTPPNEYAEIQRSIDEITRNCAIDSDMKYRHNEGNAEWVRRRISPVAGNRERGDNSGDLRPVVQGGIGHNDKRDMYSTRMPGTRCQGRNRVIELTDSTQNLKEYMVPHLPADSRSHRLDNADDSLRGKRNFDVKQNSKLKAEMESQRPEMRRDPRESQSGLVVHEARASKSPSIKNKPQIQMHAQIKNEMEEKIQLDPASQKNIQTDRYRSKALVVRPGVYKRNGSTDSECDIDWDKEMELVKEHIELTEHISKLAKPARILRKLEWEEELDLLMAENDGTDMQHIPKPPETKKEIHTFKRRYQIADVMDSKKDMNDSIESPIVSSHQAKTVFSKGEKMSCQPTLSPLRPPTEYRTDWDGSNAKCPAGFKSKLQRSKVSQDGLHCNLSDKYAAQFEKYGLK